MPEIIMGQEYLNKAEVAAELRVQAQTVQKYISRKDESRRLRATKLGGKWRIRRDDLRAFVDRESKVNVSDSVSNKEDHHSRAA